MIGRQRLPLETCIGSKVPFNIQKRLISQKILTLFSNERETAIHNVDTIHRMVKKNKNKTKHKIE